MRRSIVAYESTEPVADLGTSAQVSADIGVAVTDAQVTRASKEIAEFVGREFGLETFVETFRLEMWERPRVLQLSRTPIVAILSVTIDDVELDADEYYVDEATGELGRTDRYDYWNYTVEVTYDGGYDLPDGAPVLLQRALSRWIAESNEVAASGGGASGTGEVRDIAHGDTRISFATTSSASSSGSAASSFVADDIHALLAPFMPPITP
jgi:hypothetical protein